MIEALNSVIGFFERGGLFMWPLLICSIVALTTIILRGFALREKQVMPLVIESEIERLMPGGSPDRLMRIVENDQSSLGRIVRIALQHLRSPRSENVEAVQTRARHEMVLLEKGLIVLEVIVGIAPLLGLIGAVSGLVHVFSHLGLSSGASDTRQIALGIAEALNATVFGLSIAVPTLVAFSYFSKKVEVMSVEIETLVVELIGKCYFGRGPRGSVALGANDCPNASIDLLSELDMNFAVRKRRAPSIIIVSLVDILIILLIFFVVSTTFKKDQPEVQINLPESKTATKAPAELEHAIVAVDEADAIKLDGRPVDVDELEGAVRNLSQTQKASLALQADRKASFGTIIKVMDALKLAGVRNLPAFTRER